VPLRRFTPTQFSNAHLEAVAAACIGVLLISRIGAERALRAVAIATIALCSASLIAPGGLLFSDDHPSFFYRLSQLHDFFPHIPFYNPMWNGGVEAREFFPSGSLGIYLLFAPLLHFVSGQQAERLGEVGSARHHYEQALAGALLGRSALYVAIARLAQVEGNTTAAVDGLRSAVRLTPNDSYVHKELAAAYVAQGHVDDALCELIAALLIDPRDAHAHATIGQLFLDTDRHSDAVHAFTKALELRPDAFEVRYGLATALARLGNADDATRQFDLFERARRAAQERRRRDIASDVDPRDALAPRPSGQDGQR
jgi:tetratricopeptide (TPR) repeat protein